MPRNRYQPWFVRHADDKWMQPLAELLHGTWVRLAGYRHEVHPIPPSMRGPDDASDVVVTEEMFR